MSERNTKDTKMQTRIQGEPEAKVEKRNKELLEINENLSKEILELKKEKTETRKIINAIEQSFSSIMITDLKGRIEYVNPRFTKTTGYSKEDVIGKTPSILKSGLHDKAFYKNLWNTIKSGGTWKKSICNRKKNGELYWDLQTIAPIRGENGKISSFVSVRTDDTERKLAEEQLKEFADELERSNKELEFFASTVSHDLMEPLRKILLFGDRIKETIPNLEEKPKAYLQKMQNAAVRMNALLKDLLDFSVIQNKSNSFVKVSLKEIVCDVQENLEGLLCETKGGIILEELPDVLGEPFQMRQLFQNLIANSLKFHSTERLPEIRIYSRNLESGACEVVVEDNGIGFESTHSERIFGPFERLHGHSAIKGTGIGLAICKKIVEFHGGSIRAEGEINKGAQFIIFLPNNPNIKSQ